MKKFNQRGFHVVEALIIVVVIVTISAVGYKVATRGKTKNSSVQTPATSSQTTVAKSNSWPTAIDTKWENTGDSRGWMSLGNPPSCPNPMLFTNSPADISKATSILYPGQTRGGNYKPHGGIRFDNSKNDNITVKSPIDGYVYRGARYLVGGETQNTFDIINSCGIMVRVGHLRVLSASFQNIADKFPAATEGDSRTTKVSPVVAVKAGDAVATSVGITSGPNVFFDFGVYDLRAPNAVSKTAAYQQAHSDDKELSWHAICWFDMLPGKDSEAVKSLPGGDPSSGKTSDYCDGSGHNITTPSGPLAAPAPTNTGSGAGSGSGHGTGGGGGNGTGGGSGTH